MRILLRRLRLFDRPRPPSARVVVGDLSEMRFALHSKADRFISAPIARGEVFEPHITALFLAVLAQHDVLVDVGSNIGWFTVIGSRLASHVLAFEPDPDNLNLLRMNLRINRCRNVEVHPIALGDSDREAWLYRSADNQGDHQLSTLQDREDRVKVRVRSLDGVMARATRRITWIKLDTQGSEVAILRGMPRTLQQRPRLVIEFWPLGLERCGSSADELVEILSTIDADVWLLRHDNSSERIDMRTLAALARTPPTRPAPAATPIS